MKRITVSVLVAMLTTVSAIAPAQAAGRSLARVASISPGSVIQSNAPMPVATVRQPSRPAAIFESQLRVSQRSPHSAQVSRAQFLQQAVAMLYGSDIEEFSTPFRSVPSEARVAIGLARRVGALPRTWGSDEQWGAPVSRCEALDTLFLLAQIEPKAYTSKDFRDVRGFAKKRLVQQALAWNVLQPLTPKIFGCGRVLSGADFPVMLESIAARIDVPLAISESTPSPRAVRAPARTRRPTRARTRIQQKKEPRKVQITIGTAKSDKGSRKKVRSTRLPRHDLLESIWGIISAKYLYQDRIDENKMAEEVAKAIVKNLDDTYSAFLPPQQSSNFKKHLQGAITGIGAQVESDSRGGIIVITPITGSPAIKAGVRPSDHIVAVDGVSILEDTLQEAVEKIRGQVGTKVELTIKRNGAKIVIAIIRAKILIPEIEISSQEGVLIVKLIQFGEKTRNELTDKLKAAMAEDPKGVVLDLRNNPGGLLDAAIDVVSHFVPESTLVAQIRSAGNLRKEYTHAEKHVVPEDVPMVVLVNKGSASASEIVAGALQDHERATIVGRTTFGKGTVQEVVQFTTGESLKITIAEWLTPLGRLIDKDGVEPDIELAEQQRGDRDEQILKAIRIVKAKKRS